MNETKYQVVLSEKVIKTLNKLDKSIHRMIMVWIKKNLVDTSDPRKKGKSLSGELSGSWRYRVGDYRLICDINEQEVIIYVLKIGNRRDVYK